MINIQIRDDYKKDVSVESIISATKITFAYFNLPENLEITIVIENNKLLQELNYKYLGINSPTDVLSFKLGEDINEGSNLYLGDIVISFPIAQEQSLKNHDVNCEIQLLVIHGILHLLEFDHVTEKEQKTMWKNQLDILALLNSPIKEISPK